MRRLVVAIVKHAIRQSNLSASARGALSGDNVGRVKGCRQGNVVVRHDKGIYTILVGGERGAHASGIVGIGEGIEDITLGGFNLEGHGLALVFVRLLHDIGTVYLNGSLVA